MTENASSLPLTGVQVVDFGHFIAGPAVGMMLADLGATVVHIQPPEGPRWDSPAQAVLERNKALLRLDLKREEGVATAKDLLLRADIMIENFRPGVMERLGLGPAVLQALNPRLIAVSLPGFASTDTDHAHLRAFEPIIGAVAGMFSDMGLNRVLMGVNPSYSPLPLASAYAATIAAASAVLALFARERTGQGEQMEVPLASALLEGLIYNSVQVDAYPERYKTAREQEIERRRATGAPMDVGWQELQEYLDPFYRPYRCADGRMVYLVCPSHRYHARRALEVLGIYDILLAAGLPQVDNPYLPRDQWPDSASLGSYPMPGDWAETLRRYIAQAMLARPAAEWEALFAAAKVPCAKIRTSWEWMQDEHARAVGTFVPVPDPKRGTMIQPGPMAWHSDHPQEALSLRPGRTVTAAQALDLLGEAPTPVERAIAVASAATEQPGDSPESYLDGITVLDLSNVIAAPHAGSFLARFGARVIKIDPAKPFFDPWNTVTFGLTHGRGKQSLLLDLKAEKGQAAFRQLVKTADAIIMNATDAQLPDIGLDEETLRAVNPDVILCQLDCFGGPRRGPRSDALGYDDLVQACSGIMTRFGGGLETPEEHAHVGTIDVMCGFAGVLSLAAALFRRARTGYAARARTSLAALGNLAQLPYMVDYAGRGAWSEPSGPEIMGEGPLWRFYHCQDRPMFLAAEADQARLLATLPGLEALAHGADPTPTLERVFASAPAEHWVALLTDHGIAAAALGTLDALRQRHVRSAMAAGEQMPGSSFAFATVHTHPSGHAVTQFEPCAVRPRRSAIRPVAPTEKYGSSTRSLMQSLGLPAASVQEMLEEGWASESWSDLYLPN